MKKIIKNILLVFAICFIILSIVAMILHTVLCYDTFSKNVYPVLNGKISEDVIEGDIGLVDTFKAHYGENAPITFLAYAQGYAVAVSTSINLQIATLLVSAVISISIGIIISLTERSKFKEILIFIIIGLVLALIGTTYIHLTRNLIGVSFTDGFFRTLIEDVIMEYWLYYILIYIAVYLVKYFIGKNKAKRLNEELKKQKETV